MIFISIWVVTIFSYSIILCIRLNYPSIFFKYRFTEKNRLFFITDNNIIRAHYYNIRIFFTYQIFIIFFYRIIFFKIIPINTSNMKKKCIHFFINRGFLHIITFFFNQYDFTLFAWNNIYNFWVESVDYISYINLYQGFYWDFFFIYFYTQQLIYILFEKPYYFSKRMYISCCAFSNFWSSFNRNLIYRLIFYRIILYFFGGEGLYIDSILRICTFFFVEIIYISYSICFFLLIIK